MDLYALVVFVHAATVLIFFMLHGTSMAVAFKLRQEHEPARVRALLDVSRYALGTPTVVLVIVGLLSGILAGFMGNWWGTLWIWISLVLFLGVGFGMTPLMTYRLNPIRAAAGMTKPDAKPDEVAPPEDPAELQRLIGAWNPMPGAVIGMAAFIVILWLMLEKPI